jgi:pimeloyl-ACP methyl ester carboxylesterase
VDQFQQYYPLDGAQLYTPEFHRALYGGTLQDDFPAFHARLEENKSGLSGHGLPALIVQGNQDIIVTTPAQTVFVRELCEMGSDVRYLRLDGVRHRHTRPAGFAESVGWMESVAQGNVPLSDCSGL